MITRIYNAAGQTAFETAKSVHGLDPGTWNISNPRIKDIMTSIAGRVLGINETTRADIQRIVADGLANGDAQEKIAEALKGLYEETYTSRSLTIARTEVTNAYGKASIVAYKESGTADRAEMFDNPDHDEDYGASDGLTCADRDGMVVDLDDADDHLEAEHPNGSLTFAPVLKGED